MSIDDSEFVRSPSHPPLVIVASAHKDPHAPIMHAGIDLRLWTDLARICCRCEMRGDVLCCAVQGPVLSLEEIPEIPAELAGIWAYIMWESAGCPQRSQDAADREYREGIAELQQCLCRGKTLEELWQVRRLPARPVPATPSL